MRRYWYPDVPLTRYLTWKESAVISGFQLMSAVDAVTEAVAV
jgi:hypothetical protein